MMLARICRRHYTIIDCWVTLDIMQLLTCCGGHEGLLSSKLNTGRHEVSNCFII